MNDNKLKQLNDEQCLMMFHSLNERFNQLVNDGNDDEADIIEAELYIYENELLSRDIDLKLIYA
jgi:streptomycin 6-kinase